MGGLIIPTTSLSLQRQMRLLSYYRFVLFALVGTAAWMSFLSIWKADIFSPPPYESLEQMHQRRGIQVIKQGELIVFLHIPLTGGYTFVNFLYDTFKTTRVISPHAETFMNIRQPELLLNTTTEDWNSWDLLYAHEDYSLSSVIPRQHRTAVMLRDPVYLIKSVFYTDMESVSTTYHKDFSKFVENKLAFTPGANQTLADYQVRWMAGVSPGPWPGSWYSEEKQQEILTDHLLEEAKNNLEKTDFIGLADYYHETLCLFWYTFDLPPREDFEALPLETKYPPVSDSASTAFTKIMETENKFYDYAKKIFFSRFRQMKQGLKRDQSWPKYCYRNL